MMEVVDANHTHIFWTCNKLIKYWKQVRATISKIIGYKIPNTCPVLYLGNITNVADSEDICLVKIMLAASRKAITKRWLKPDPPSPQDWIKIVEEISLMESIIYNLRLRGSEFHKQWRKLKLSEGDTQKILTMSDCPPIVKCMILS